METYTATLIGKLIAAGGEHLVFAYGTNQVIKFSLFDFVIGKAAARTKAEYDLSVCERIFGTFLVPTRIVRSENGNRIAKVQPKITGRPLRPQDLKDPNIAEQFSELVRRHETLLLNENEEIDLLGGYGALAGRLTNIFLTENRSLCIIDALLISVSNAPFWAGILIMLRPILSARQRWVISRYLNASALV